SSCFSYTHPPPPETDALSLHDALPISGRSEPVGRTPWSAAGPLAGFLRLVQKGRRGRRPRTRRSAPLFGASLIEGIFEGASCLRSEEHTSELQSLRHLVCRLLLEKKKR